MTDKPEREREELSDLLKLVMSLGLTVCLGIFLFFFIGIALDRYFQLSGVCTISGLLLGICMSFLWAYRTICKHLDMYSRDASTEKKDYDE